MLLSDDLLQFLAQIPTPAAPAAPGAASGAWMQFVVFGLFIAAMWFLMIAPQRKKQKEHQKMLSELKSGDEILTAGGIYGTVTSVREDRIVVRIADSAKVEIAKGFVQSVVSRKQDDEKKS